MALLTVLLGFVYGLSRVCLGPPANLDAVALADGAGEDTPKGVEGHAVRLVVVLHGVHHQRALGVAEPDVLRHDALLAPGVPAGIASPNRGILRWARTGRREGRLGMQKPQ